jgi:pSer/pThr/pTyr-binding forkhead associated (FHA) protein
VGGWLRRHAALPDRTPPPPFPPREVERASSLAKVVAPYIIDLETVNGTFVNGQKIEPSRRVYRGGAAHQVQFLAIGFIV